MKTMKWMCANAALAAMFVAGIPAFGATAKSRVNVPFAFEVAGKIMPAGVYTIKSSETKAFVTLEAANGERAMTMVKTSINPAIGTGTRLVFEKEDGSYKLKQVIADSTGPDRR